MTAIANASLLSDCRRELVDIFMRNDLEPSDYVELQIHCYQNLSAHLDSDEAARWTKASIMSDKATAYLQAAISLGRLPVWRIHNAKEVLLTPLHLENGNIVNGIYKSHQHPSPEMQGAYLWIKNDDWLKYVSAVAPQRDQPAGRPNRTDEAVLIHKDRCSNGTALSALTKEARAIHATLAERHKGDPEWKLEPESIARALRRYRKSRE